MSVQLVDLLERYRQNFNLGAEDLARLVGAAELQAAAQRTGPIAAESIMSRDLVTVSPHTSAEDVATLFRRHRFTSIPVVEDGRYVGVIFQIHLIGANATDSAVRLMQADVPHATPQAPIGALLPMMSDGDVDAVPILDGDRIIGIVTRTDLISALARHSTSISGRFNNHDEVVQAEDHQAGLNQSTLDRV